MFWLECKKILLRKDILIWLLVFLFANATKIGMEYRGNPGVYDIKGNPEWELYRTALEGEMTTETASRVKQGAENVIQAMMSGKLDASEEDYYYYSISDLYQYQYEYDKNMQLRIEEARENIGFYLKSGNSYDARWSDLFCKLYGRRYIRDFYDSEGFPLLFRYQFSAFLLIVFAFLLSIKLFYEERQNQTEALLLTTKKGRRTLYGIKLLVFAAGMALMSLLLALEDAFVFQFFYELRGWGNPVYAIREYEMCVLNVSIWQYYLLLWGMRYLGLISGGFVLIVVSLLFMGYLEPVVGELLLLTAWIVGYEQGGTALMGWNILGNPVALLNGNQYLMNYEVMSILGVPVLTGAAACICQFLLGAVCCLLVRLLFQKHFGISMTSKG